MSTPVVEATFKGRTPIYPRSVQGRFRRFKDLVLVLAYGIYFGLPWIRWERPEAADQAVMFDIASQRFYLFDLVIFAQDIFLLAGFLMVAALLLFFVTGLAGRAFCGYFCFQTLWTDVFMKIERWVQGERPARMKLDQAPWSAGKLGKKALTHGLWLLVAFATGLTFTLYWGNAPDLVQGFFGGDAAPAMVVATLLLTATTYTMAGIAREQVCTFMCPYARFQSAMFDRDTLIVAYDRNRGEGEAGRGKVSRDLKTREGRQAEGVGDCIDCGYCVQVCPTGIDIRNGLQYECISCALCIDACDNIMDTLGWRRGLIRYTSERALEGGKTRYVKPKSVGYALVITVLIGVFAGVMLNRAPYEIVVSQQRQPLYVVRSDGAIQNSYEIKVTNKTQAALELAFRLEGLPAAALDMSGFEQVTLDPEQSLRLRARVRGNPAPGTAARQEPFRFIATPVNAAGNGSLKPLSLPASFYWPER